NIIAVAGTYDVTFDVATGNYTFSGGAPIPVVDLFGTATNPSAGIAMSTTDGVVYTLGTTTLLAGNAQFSVDGTTVGATAFPSGTATGVATDFIPVPAGKYTSITYDNSTGIYSFVAAPLYPSMAIVGSGVAGGWGGTPDVNQMTTTDGIIYTIKGLAITAWDNVPGSGKGEIKFRENSNWSDPNFGGTAFPIGVTGGNNIVVGTAGTYDCIFNVVTGVYRFNLSSQPPVSIVGAGAGGWPGDLLPTPTPTPDTNLMATTDGENYTLNNLVLTAGDIKFRQDYAWDTSWGGTLFPTGTPSGTNLTATAGTWNVTFTRSTGAYTFTTSLAVKGFNASSFSAYPNPTQSSWTITSGSDAITSVQIFDVLGQSVYAKTTSSNEVSVNASNLSKGTYLAKVATANGSSTIKLVKN
ncbi:T9SS type A sorting domain-containing protein, partial [Flavobacterium sp.]|uniref:T9SS type A sorting domain-containing protein n=1 Tax=Flavobacterium sp. TaxID=239 RepID=UPI0037A34C8A